MRPESEADYATPLMTADLVILSIREGVLHVLLVKRGTEPYLNRYALPGGFVHHDEQIIAAARRELQEETGLDDPSMPLEAIGYYDALDRDPRGRVITFSFLSVTATMPAPYAHRSSDVRIAVWKPVAPMLGEDSRLAFDHVAILRDAVYVARDRLQYTTLATRFLPEEFTIAELRAVYEAVWGFELDRANFHRKVKDAREFIVETGDVRVGSEGRLGRPAKLYRAGEGSALVSPILMTLPAGGED
ncbi:NUDIX hydrolase [Nocardia beijingensis]|uniref:NUDIX hydrolase n=1 Tax=Nocardia beijingensis TaxID=95162 RepID=UPI0033B14183